MIVNRMRLFGSPTWLDEHTFEAIFVEHYARIYSAVYRLVGDRMEADDITAETFWKLWEKPPAQAGNIGGWLYRVAIHLGYNALRSERRRAWHESHASREDDDPQTAQDPGASAEQSIERARVRAILRSMPLRDVQILVLRHSGLRYREIAGTLQIPVASVGSYLARAEEKFEALYRQGERDEPITANKRGYHAPKR